MSAQKKIKDSSAKQIVAKSNFLLQLPSDGLSIRLSLGGLCRNDL